MRIVCPSCHAIYDVPDALLATGQGRRPARLRCARCATEWAPELPPAQPSNAEPTEAGRSKAEPPTGTPPAPGPTPSAFADAIAEATAPRPPEPPAPPPADKPRAAPRPLSFERTPSRPAGETLVAEHLATGRPRPDHPGPDRAPARSPRDSATLMFAWTLSIAVLVAALSAAYLHRAEVIAFWPPAARAYDLLGLK